MSYVKQQLYGGAITTHIPNGLLDASTLRQIPDSQEVFLNPKLDADSEGMLREDDTLIIELMERLENDTDLDSIKEHLSEISNLNGVGKTEWQILKLHEVLNPSLIEDKAYIAVVSEPAKKWGRETEGTIELTLVLVFGILRINKLETDLLVNLNLPFKAAAELKALKALMEDEETHANEGNSAWKRISQGDAVVTKVLESMRIEDWGLFGM
ncbi:hypothetical protein BABINDRAFT_161733 [Babjeviella inositovora NRRL Y-12698]|uniref:Mog1p/PsbP-like protein n=1 Tax=Babjeviella inositovora NRRL Y-12698 TaxID=984486 RepID=A0A1E3QPE1_9ASCO|nr:uncharacterized protein BABINDRAFT_161733 [Babjeviella inositovora NRRL Y-12698]ODQ79324.1 hypothetical protein BABINDRAFT_161733 [Babjeviella inositovora NRRL Y-12698]